MTSGKSLPKFGDWNEQDPHSGDGFTHIFNAARDERNAGGPTRLQPEAPPKMHLRDKQQNAEPHKFSFWGCCFRSSNAA